MRTYIYIHTCCDWGAGGGDVPGAGGDMHQPDGRPRHALRPHRRPAPGPGQNTHARAHLSFVMPRYAKNLYHFYQDRLGTSRHRESTPKKRATTQQEMRVFSAERARKAASGAF